MIRTVIADDEVAVVSIIKYFVEKENLPLDIVGVAYKGYEAVELIKEKKPQLVFLDIQMPTLDGFGVMEKIEESNIIIITAYESFQYAQRAMRLGAKDIILKPIEYKQLTQSINRVMGWKFTSNNTVNEILQYIHNNYNQKIDLKTIANKFYMNPDYLSRIFKTHMGMTIIKYIHKVRINKSIEILRNEKSSVKEVALEVGYDNLNNFYKHFKDITGQTPAYFVQHKFK